MKIVDKTQKSVERFTTNVGESSNDKAVNIELKKQKKQKKEEGEGSICY